MEGLYFKYYTTYTIHIRTQTCMQLLKNHGSPAVTYANQNAGHEFFVCLS